MKRPDTDDAIPKVRAMRRNATEPERRLWAKLRNRQLANLKFRRQVWITHYIADFLCAEAKLIIEVDGETHATTEVEDRQRTARLTQEGFTVLRFTNTEVMTNIEGVLQTIMTTATSTPSPSPSALPSRPLPLPHGERSQ